MRILLSIAVPHGHIFVATSSFSRLLVYLFLLSGRSRSPTRNHSFSFSSSLLGRGDTFSPQYLSSIPRVSPSASPLSLYFLALSFPFFYSFFYFCLVPAKLLCRQYLFLVSPYILPYFLDYVIQSYSSSPFRYFLQYSNINYGWQVGGGGGQ